MSDTKICPQCGETFSPDERFCPKDGTALRPTGATDGLIGQVIADRYQILRALGEGGMGRVYLAEHVRMGRKSAVKVMSADLALAADAITRFNREAANASRINHPNVAQIYDFGETDDGTLYLAMEFVEGETLSAIIDREGALLPARAAALSKQVADALGAAHHLGIVHRDLKPDNIMVGRHHDGSDWVKVVDFGIAKTVQSGERGSQTVTTAGVSIGTPDYMSPEQLAGDRLDPRTDIYSLGLVLFNMLTRDLPYPRLTSKETLVKRLTSKPRTLLDVVPSGTWPSSLQAVLDKALAPEPDDRYATVGEFGRDVMAVASELGAYGQTVPVQSVSRPITSAPVPQLTPTVATPAVVLPPRSGATAKIDTPIPTTNPTASVTARRRSPALMAAGVLIVVGAAGAGAFAALRNRPSTEQQPPAADTTARPTSVPTPQPVAVDSTKSVAAAAPKAAEPTKAAEKFATKTNSTVVEKSVASKPASSDSAKSPPTAATSSPAPPTQAGVASTNPTSTVSADSIGRRREKKLAFNRQLAASAASDSGTGEEAKIRQIGGQIQEHVTRANGFIKAVEVQKARLEYRDAAEAVALLRQLYGGTPGAMRAEGMIRQAVMQTLNICRGAVADSTTKGKFPPNFRCESFIPLNMRPQGRGRGTPRGF